MNNNLKKVLEGYFANVYSVISEKYDIPVSDLENIFESLFEKEPHPKTKTPAKASAVVDEKDPQPKKKNRKPTTDDVDEKVPTSCKCVYVFERSGKNNKKGDVCGVKIKGEGELCSKHKGKTPTKTSADDVDEKVQAPCKCVYVFERTGKNNKKGDVCGVKIKGEGDLCSKHKDKKTNSDKKDKKKIPKPRIPSKKKKEKENVGEVIEDDIIEKEIKEAKPKVILKKHKDLGVFYHAETRFVFESPIERIIIGKLSDDDLIYPITDDDEPMVKKYKFIVG